MKRYIKDGQIIIAGTAIDDGNFTYLNPTAKRYADLGWKEYTETPTLSVADMKANKLEAIAEYDVSSAVNSFYLYGESMWLDKATRVGLVNAVNASIALGKSEVELGLGAKSYTIDCQAALQMLYTLEDYALKCYNRTLAHRNAISAMESIEQIENYDHTSGYPEKPIFE